jgi:hypothetical protein
MTGVQMIAISGHILPRPSHHNPGRGRKATSALEAKRTSANATLPLIAPLLTRMYGPAVRCKRTLIELADVRSCINVSGL